MNDRSRSQGSKLRICPAAATDLRNLVESFAHPIVVCGDEGEMHFGNTCALNLFGEQVLAEGLLPDDWIDTDRVDWEDEGGERKAFRLLWEEIVWQGNAAWFLVAVPDLGGPAAEKSNEDLKVQLKQSMEMIAEEAQRREKAEGERQRLEAKLKDLHQRSVAKIEAARSALENEKFEREAILSRISRLKSETDQLRQQLEEKNQQVEEHRRSAIEGFSLSGQESEALADALDRAEKFRKLHAQLEVQFSELREKHTIAVSRLRAAEQRLHQYQKSLNGSSASVSFEEDELRARIEELETQLAERSREAQETGPSSLEMLEQECTALRRELADKSSRLNELEGLVGSSPGSGDLAARLQKADQACQDLELTVVELRAHQSQELEELRASLRQSQKLLAEQGSEVADPAEVKALRGRVAELESGLERAQTEASPEELTLARRRISELEAAVVAASAGGGGSSNWEQEKAQLVAEVHQGRSRLDELSKELKRVLDGDRETKKLAYADQLTGLPNFHLTGQYLQVCFERSNRREGALALLLLDLDNFRRVNDALGQKIGDELLRQVGGRVQQSVTEKDTAIARRGEDEFMVVAFLEGASAGSEALLARVRGIANVLLEELAKPFEVQTQRVQVTASIGVALYPGPAADRDELLEQAEHAMYKAKEAGRGRVVFFSEELHQKRQQRKRIEDELRRGVVEGQFALFYQPIFEIPSLKPKGVEALVRWSHPLRGLLEPAEFLEVAEESGLILPLGDQLVAEALQLAKQKFMKRHFLTLNLSHRQLIDSGFPARFMKQLERAGVKPHDVYVEVSERVSQLDPERVRNALAHLAHWGVGVVLDDFGSGISDLSLLRHLPIRLLKLDRELVAKLPEDREAAKLCLALTRFAGALDIPVVAEGVESKEQLEQIRGCGCRYVQGFLLGEPMNPNQLLRVM